MTMGSWFSQCFGGVVRSGSRLGTSSSQHGKKKSRYKANQVTPEQEIKLKNLEKVLKELECPICFNTCIPPIYTCINGHILCYKCKKNVTECPTCRQGFSSTRNLFAEQFIEQYSQGCRYSKEGCKFLKWKGDDMQPHERECDYRMVRCIVPSCSHTVSYQKLLEHLVDTHKIQGSDFGVPVIVSYTTLQGEPQPIVLQDRRWMPYYIKVFGCTFYVMFELARPHFWAWVWVHCPKAELTQKYNFISTLKLDNRKNLSMEWKGPVYPIRTRSLLITRDGPCFGGADTVLQHFEEDGIISLYVNIERIHGGFSDGSVSDGGPCGSSSTLNFDSESQMHATGDLERERNFSRMVLAASSQIMRRRSTTTTSTDIERKSRRSSRGK